MSIPVESKTPAAARPQEEGKMDLVQQPPGSSACGQCVIAMLTGIPLGMVLEHFGDGRTYPRNMRQALATYGLSIPIRSEVGNCSAPQGMGAAMLWGERQHWVAWCNGEWYDPAASQPVNDLSHYQATVALYPIKEPTT